MSKAIVGAAELGAAIGLSVLAVFDPVLVASPLYDKLIIGLALAGMAEEAGAVADALTSNRGMGVTTRQPASYRQIVYGEQRVPGVIIYQNTTGSKHDQWNFVIVLATHECDSIVNLYLDGRKVVWQGSGPGWAAGPGGNYFGGAAGGGDFIGPGGQHYNFDTLVYCEARYGNQLSGDVIGALTANDPAWAASALGSPYVGGCTYVYLKVERDTSMFPALPEIRFTLRGKNDIYDPRTATRGYSTNWALCVADAISGSPWGLGDNTVNQDQLIAAANVCDEQIPLAAGLVASTAGEVITLGGGGGRASSMPTVDVTITGDGTGATAVANLSEITSGGVTFWVCTGYTITAGGSGYTHATASIETGGWTTPPSVGVPQISVGESSTLTEAQYSLHWHYDTSVSPGDALQTMMSAAAGRLVRAGGEWLIFPAYWQGPSFSFDQNALVGNISWIPRRSVTDLINRVTGTYIAANYPYNVSGNLYDSNGWFDGTIQNNFPYAFQPTNYPMYACDQLHGYGDGVDVYLTQDGGIPHPREVAQPCCLSISQAQRCAKVFLLRNRQQGSGSFPMNLAAWQAEPCDVMQFTMLGQGWVNKYMEFVNIRFKCEEVRDRKSGKPSRRLYVNAGVQETDPSIYEWSMAEELSAYDVPTASGRGVPYIVSPPTSLAIEDDATTQVILQDGTTAPRMLVTWVPPADTYVANGGSIQVQYMLNTIPGAAKPVGPFQSSFITENLDTSWSTGWVDGGTYSGIATNAFVNGINASQFANITVQVRAVRSNGAASAWVQVANHTLNFSQPTIPVGHAGGGPSSGPIIAFPGGVTLDQVQPAEAGADSTGNRIAVVSGVFPGTFSVSIAPGASAVLGSAAVSVTSVNDTFLVMAQIAEPITGGISGAIVQVDGAGNYGSVSGSGALIASITGLSVGSHTIQIVATGAGGGTGQVTSIPQTTVGHYTTSTPPTVNITGTGTGAAAVAVMAQAGSPISPYWVLAYITITAGGSGYTSATASLSGGAGAPDAVLGTPVIGSGATPPNASWSSGSCQIIVQQVAASPSAGFNTAPPGGGTTVHKAYIS